MHLHLGGLLQRQVSDEKSIHCPGHVPQPHRYVSGPEVWFIEADGIGYILLATIPAVGGRYFALFIIAMGLYITPGLNVTWIGNNTQGHFKRSTAVGLNQLIGNSAGAA